MIHKAWCSIEEVPYYFSRSYIKFQGHTDWKIDDLDKIWARLLGPSQLLNPSDLPLFEANDKIWAKFYQFYAKLLQKLWTLPKKDGLIERVKSLTKKLLRKHYTINGLKSSLKKIWRNIAGSWPNDVQDFTRTSQKNDDQHSRNFGTS